MNSTQILLNGLCALIGAIIGCYVPMCIKRYHDLSEYCSLLKGLIVECKYNRSILDEMLNGAINRSVSFKRLTTGFFEKMQTEAVRHCANAEVLEQMTIVNCDERVFNRELDTIENECLSKTRQQLGKTLIVNARKGVDGSLEKLENLAQKELSRLTFRSKLLKSLI